MFFRTLQLLLLIIGTLLLCMSTANVNVNVTSSRRRHHRHLQETTTNATDATIIDTTDNTADDNTDTDGISLLDGTLRTRTNVGEYADLALDLRDLRTFANSANIARMQGLYLEGLYSEIVTGRRFALQYLSQDLANTVDASVLNLNKNTDALLLPSKFATPRYLFHLYGNMGGTLHRVNNNWNEAKDVANYASDTIEQTIASHPELAADAILALSYWMYATHVLYHGVCVCRQKTLADNPDLIFTTTTTSRYGMDEFIALWIGQDQKVASNDGHALYAWTQEIATLFGTDQNGMGEAKVNTNLKLLYQEGAAALAIPTACRKDDANTEFSTVTASVSQTEAALWSVSQRMVQQMMIPLFQWTIYHLLEQNTIALQLYAKALIPQLSMCGPSLFKRLQGHLLQTSSVIDYATQTNDILRDLQQAYTTCFQLTCQDIGIYENPTFTALQQQECIQKSNSTSDTSTAPLVLAGYKTSTRIGALYKLDMDVYHMKVLMGMNQFDFARLIYLAGFNVPVPRDSESDPYQLLSMQQIALDGEPSTALQENPWYAAFVSYYNDREYYNSQVVQALDVTKTIPSIPSSTTISTVQRMELVALTCAFAIVPLQIVMGLKNAVKLCNDDTLSASERLHPFEESVALIIGSLQGSSEGGSSDSADAWYSVWGMANQYAFDFQQLNEYNFAVVNDELLDELYGAKGMLYGQNCRDFELSVDHIQKLILVGIIQGIIYAAVETEQMDVTSNNNDIPAEVIQGHVLTQALVPLMDAETANVMEENMVLTSAKTVMVQNGAQFVAETLGYWLAASQNLSCQYLGRYKNVEPCRTAPSLAMGPSYGATAAETGSDRASAAAASSRRYYYESTMLTGILAGIVTFLFM